MLSLLESGNLPDFAQGNPLAFWMAADTHERVNGRVYTELQVALPRELNQQQTQGPRQEGYLRSAGLPLHLYLGGSLLGAGGCL